MTQNDATGISGEVHSRMEKERRRMVSNGFKSQGVVHLVCLALLAVCCPTRVMTAYAKAEPDSPDASGGLYVRVIPAPRVVQVGTGDAPAGPLRLLSSESEDRFAAAQIEATTRRGPVIRVGRAGQPAMEREIARRKLDRAALQQPEGYLLDSRAGGVLVAGADAAGLFYGIQTLRQLLRQGRVPKVTIADWPALRYRGLSVDISRGPILTEEQMRAVVRTCAEYKMNMVSFYMEHVFRYDHSPLAAPDGAGIDSELMRRMDQYARQYHIDLVPQQQTFGHLHSLLKHELYADLASAPYGHVLAPDNERTYEWVGQAAKQLTGAFSSTFLHIGSDEAEGISGDAYMHHMRQVAKILRPLGKKLMFWGDIALRYPELMHQLPKDLIAMSWDYDPRPDFSAWITPFRENGMEVFVCPGLSNSSMLFPNVAEAVANIDGFVADGKKLGAAGMLVTHWNGDGDAFFNLNWYGIVFSAAAAWQPGRMDRAAFDGAFDWVFYRNSHPIVANVVARFERAQKLLNDAGAGELKTYKMFWMDPFSASGARVVSKAYRVAPAVRKLAEENLLDLATLDPAQHGDTIASLRFAAKRLDWLGSKIVFSKRIADLYRDALEHLEEYRGWEDLHSIASNDGLIDDLLAGILELRELHKAVWQGENRPCWLENVQIRYDAEALYWRQKAQLISALTQNLRHTKTLPEANAVGLVLPQ